VIADESTGDNSFVISLHYNLKNCFAQVRYYKPDYEKIHSLKDFNLSWRKIPIEMELNSFCFAGNGKKNPKDLYYSSIQHSFLRLPYIITRKVEDVADILLKTYAKRDVRAYKSLYRGQSFLQALVNSPYEIALYDFFDVNKYGRELKKYVEHDNFDCYNAFCEHLGFKSFPTLRKMFEIKPSVLIAYAFLFNVGFRNKNIMIYAIKSFCENLVNIYLLNVELEDFKFFFDVSRVYRGEKTIINAIFRDKKSSIREIADTAKMFREFYTLLAVEERNKIVQEGLTRRNHDLLVKFYDRIESENISFEHSERTLKMEMSIKSYDFIVIKDSDSLHKLGSMMNNCVYSYKMSIVNKQCVIVCALVDDLPTICIEVRKFGGVVQALGRYNRRLSIEEKSIVNEWWSKACKFI